jgi:hypothetical protein
MKKAKFIKVNEDLWDRCKAQAALAHKSMEVWATEALAEKLEKSQGLPPRLASRC